MNTLHERILIWGAGQHGRVVGEIARAAGYTVAGFADADARKLGRPADAAGADVIISEVDLLACLRRGRALPEGVDAIVPAVGDNKARFAQVRCLGELLAPPMIHPTAYISPSALIQAGSVVCPMAVVNTGARVGYGVIVNTHAVVGHDSVVADAAHICAGVILAGTTRVGVRAFVAAGAVLIPGIVIGDDAIAGAGAVVIRDVASGVTVVGVPADPIKRRPPWLSESTYRRRISADARRS